MQASNEPSPKSTGFRFSILTILLVTAIVALSIFAYQSRQELADAQIEMAHLRQDNHLLAVVDPDRIYARPIPGSLDSVRQWRVYLPEGATYQLQYDWNSIPPKPSSRGTVFRRKMRMEPGTYIVTQAFLHDPSDELYPWKLHLAFASRSLRDEAQFGFQKEDVPWLVVPYKQGQEFYELPASATKAKGRTVEYRMVNLSQAITWIGDLAQKDFTHDEPVELLRQEVVDPKHRPNGKPGDYLPLDVFRLWIEVDNASAAANPLLTGPQSDASAL